MDEIDGKVALALVSANGNATTEWDRAGATTRSYFLAQARTARLAVLKGMLEHNMLPRTARSAIICNYIRGEIARLESEDRTQSTGEVK